MDWKNSLEALRSSLPEGEEPAQEPEAATEASQTARLDIILDRKGRKGKVATIVAGFTISDQEVEALASRLRQRLGTGGSARGGEILVQGDKRQAVLDALVQWGYKARII
ncbi:MAG: translation initiation factor [Muribaculaceae bacterium]|nr:translation initiation factor [Muribaculaceae bacterium]